MFQQVEAKQGAQAVQVVYSQDINLESPVHDSSMTEPVAWSICLFADHAVMFENCCNRWRQREVHKLSKWRSFKTPI